MSFAVELQHPQYLHENLGVDHLQTSSVSVFVLVELHFVVFFLAVFSSLKSSSTGLRSQDSNLLLLLLFFGFFQRLFEGKLRSLWLVVVAGEEVRRRF